MKSMKRFYKCCLFFPQIINSTGVIQGLNLSQALGLKTPIGITDIYRYVRPFYL